MKYGRFSNGQSTKTDFRTEIWMPERYVTRAQTGVVMVPDLQSLLSFTTLLSLVKMYASAKKMHLVSL